MATRCPCLSGIPYDECCGPLHRGEAAARTAEELMRSRYSAYAVGDADYVRRTWHPSGRPRTLDLQDGTRWYRLDVLAVTGGGAADTHGTVEFRAYYRAAGGAGTLHEVSRFVRDGGAWVYLDALG